MIRINESGKAAVIAFITQNHIDGWGVYMDDSFLHNCFIQLETDYRQNGHATLVIDLAYLREGDSDDMLFMEHSWFDHIDTRIGINDTISPDLLKKRISDW